MKFEPETLLWPGTAKLLGFLFAILISFKIVEYLGKKIGLINER
jgi:hypothetical protein